MLSRRLFLSNGAVPSTLAITAVRKPEAAAEKQSKQWKHAEPALNQTS